MTATTADINGGTIDGTVIGGASAAAGTFAALTGTTGTFSSNVTISTADNTNTLTLTSTDADANSGPNLKLYRNSGTPADNDYGGYLLFNAENDADEDIAFSYVGQQLLDVSDGSENGRLFFYNMQAGASVNALDILPTETVFNEGSVDRDFRVEGNGNANMLFVDAGNDRLGVGTGSPDSLVHISGAGGTAVFTFENPDTGLSTNETIGQINFETQDSGGAGVNAYIKAAGANTSGAAYIAFGTGTGGSPVERLRINNSGVITVGADSGTQGKLFMTSTDRFNLTTADGLGIQLDNDNNRIAPVDASGSYNNNVSLGSSSLPFKDLHIDRIYFNETAGSGMSSSAMDSYEEGTFTPVFVATSTNPTTNGASSQAKYVKVGSTVHVTARLYWSSLSGGSGDLQVAGFPFTSGAITGSWWAGTLGYTAAGHWDSGKQPQKFMLAASDTGGKMWVDDGTYAVAAGDHDDGAGELYIQITYHTF